MFKVLPHKIKMKMKKHITLSLICLAFFTAMNAQEYKLAKNSGRINIKLNGVTVEGYNGTEILFKSSRINKEKGSTDERSKGLRLIDGSGYQDNTGLGISVTEKDNVVEVYPIEKTNTHITIMVPKGMVVNYSNQQTIHASRVLFMNMENELSITTTYAPIRLENITGPVTVYSAYGTIDAKFSENIKGPISINSPYAYVDVSLPTTVKADIKMSTSYGEMLAASDFKIDIEKTGDMIQYSNRVKGKINGGGTSISLQSSYGKVYLRKAQ
jgi:hypothetical protein